MSFITGNTTVCIIIVIKANFYALQFMLNFLLCPKPQPCYLGTGWISDFVGGGGGRGIDMGMGIAYSVKRQSPDFRSLVVGTFI